MRRSILIGAAASCLAAASACGNEPQAGQITHDPIRLVPPTLQTDPGARLTGRVFVAREPILDPATGRPPGYGPLPGAGTVAVWQVACGEPCGPRVEVAISGGSYAFDGLPIDEALVVEASGPGLSPRRILTYLRADTQLDFAADPGRSTGPYLVDSPEVIAVDPAAGQTLEPGSTLKFRITYSEPVDPATVRPDSVRLESRDIPGLEISGDTSYLAKAASVRLEGPATVVLEIPGPVATLAGVAGAAIGLTVGKGSIREASSGRVVASSPETATVAGLAWSPGAPAIGYHLAGDSAQPRVVAVTSTGFAAEGVRLRMRWSEPMAVMLNRDSPQGKVGAGLLEAGAYEFRDTGAARKSDTLSDVLLQSLTLDARDPTLVTAIATGSLPSLDRLEITPRDVHDPAGNPATGSARVVEGLPPG